MWTRYWRRDIEDGFCEGYYFVAQPTDHLKWEWVFYTDEDSVCWAEDIDAKYGFRIGDDLRRPGFETEEDAMKDADKYYKTCIKE